MHSRGGDSESEAGAERARSSGSQLHLPTSHQVAVAHWWFLMGFVRLLPKSSSESKEAGYSRVRPHSAEGRRVSFSSFKVHRQGGFCHEAGFVLGQGTKPTLVIGP